MQKENESQISTLNPVRFEHILFTIKFKVFRIARIMRIFKLARRSVGLQSIAYTVKTSYKVTFKFNLLH